MSSKHKNVRISTKATIAPDVKFGNNILIEDNVILRKGVTVLDNVVISKGAIVRENATILENCRIARYSDVYEDVTLCEGTRVFVRAKILKGAYIGENCIIGADAVISGAITNNVKIPSNAFVNAPESVTGNVQVYSNGTQTVTLFETSKNAYVQNRGGAVLPVSELTVSKDPFLYSVAKVLLPDHFGFCRKLLNKLLA